MRRLRQVFAFSELVAVAQPGEKLGSVIVAGGEGRYRTVCSVVVNGVLSKSGVPISSKFGGVLELRKPKQERFVAIIYYEGTSLDPSEQYIRARMTSVREAAKTGKGRILAITVKYRLRPGLWSLKKWPR